jgi:hypothetical protein
VGDEKDELCGEKGNFKSRIGLYQVTEIHQNFSTSKYPTKASDLGGLGSFGAAFGAYAIKMGPNAAGQWMHGTKALIGDFSVVTGLGSGSHGCIRTTNSNIEDLAQNIQAGTPILRIYASRVNRPGESHDAANLYGYKDVRARVFTPEQLKLSGPGDAPLGPRDADTGGVKDFRARLTRLGFTLEDTKEPLPKPAAKAPAKVPANAPPNRKAGKSGRKQRRAPVPSRSRTGR